MPVVSAWLDGLPNQQDPPFGWEAAMDEDLVGFSQLSDEDMVIEKDDEDFDDNNMFPMADDASMAHGSVAERVTADPVDQHITTGDSDVYDASSIAQSTPEDAPEEAPEASSKASDSDVQSTVSSKATSNASDHPISDHPASDDPASDRPAPSKGKQADKPVCPAIPLICHICERNPTFSDVSHLLTHCSSRAHTKRHFDVRARALTDATAKATLGTYDRWYEVHKIGPMINRRLMEKDAKDQARKIETEKRKSAQPPAKKRKTESKALSKSSKKEQKPAIDSPHPSAPQSIEPTLTIQNFANLPFHRDSNSDSVANSIHSHRPSTSQGQATVMAESEYEDLPIPGLESPAGSAFAPSETGLEYTEMDAGGEHKQPTLKGKFWPGMDIFDSASEQNRRRRNQRKDASVLQKMQRSSSSIQTTMLVFDANWDRSSDRDVYDEPSCDELSPLKKPSSAKKRKMTPKKPGRTKGKTTARIKSEPRTPRAARVSNTSALQSSAPPRRATRTRGSAARAQAEIARLARNELEDIAAEDSDDEGGQPPIKTSGSVTPEVRDHSARPSTAGVSHDGIVGVDTSDVYQDLDAGPADMNPMLGGHGPARLPRRNRMPLQALSRNLPSIASSNFSSPTPSSKPVPQPFAGKENNSMFKQGMMVQNPAVQEQSLGSQGMMFPNMGMQGMPRSLWPGNMAQTPYGYGYQTQYSEPMLFGSAVGTHQTSTMMQPQMNNMYHDDLHHSMFQPHSAMNDGQSWHTNGNDLGSSHASQALGGIGNGWMGNASGSGYDDDQHPGHFHDS